MNARSCRTLYTGSEVNEVVVVVVVVVMILTVVVVIALFVMIVERVTTLPRTNLHTSKRTRPCTCCQHVFLYVNYICVSLYNTYIYIYIY